MTRPRKGTEKKFKQILNCLKDGVAEHIKHYKYSFFVCSKYKIGHAVTKFKELVNCNECLKRINK